MRYLGVALNKRCGAAGEGCTGKLVLGLTMAALMMLAEISSAACVSNIRATTPLNRFTANGDGTVTDNKTGLMWTRCTLGQNATSPGCSGFPSVRTWPQAVTPIFVHLGYTDWRLPNIKELQSIVEQSCESPAFNFFVFPGVPADAYYWSSSVYPTPGFTGADSRAFAVRSYNGTVRGRDRNLLGHVRLVRDP